MRLSPKKMIINIIRRLVKKSRRSLTGLLKPRKGLKGRLALPALLLLPLLVSIFLSYSVLSSVRVKVSALLSVNSVTMDETSGFIRIDGTISAMDSVIFVEGRKISLTVDGKTLEHIILNGRLKKVKSMEPIPDEGFSRLVLTILPDGSSEGLTSDVKIPHAVTVTMEGETLTGLCLKKGGERVEIKK